MKAAAIIIRGKMKSGVGDIVLPSPSATDIVTETLLSGVSMGTESWILQDNLHKVTFPLVPGYQNIGVVEKVGAKVRGFKTGDRVFAEYTRISKKCGITLKWGGHASRCVLDYRDAVKVPESANEREICLATMPATTLHGINIAGGIKKGETVLVIGQGLIGQMSAQHAKNAGARVITVDLIAKRVKLSGKYSAHLALNGGRIDLRKRIARELGIAAKTLFEVPAQGLDVVIDTTGRTGMVNTCLDLIRTQGRIIMQAFYPDPDRVDFRWAHCKEARILFTTGLEPSDVRKAISDISEKKLKIEPLITHVVSCRELPEIYRQMVLEPQTFLGIVVDWTK